MATDPVEAPLDPPPPGVVDDRDVPDAIPAAAVAPDVVPPGVAAVTPTIDTPPLARPLRPQRRTAYRRLYIPTMLHRGQVDIGDSAIARRVQAEYARLDQEHTDRIMNPPTWRERLPVDPRTHDRDGNYLSGAAYQAAIGLSNVTRAEQYYLDYESRDRTRDRLSIEEERAYWLELRDRYISSGRRAFDRERRRDY